MLPTRNTSDSKSLTATAPAKLIISGEHSVLYGQPALAVAVNRYTSTTTTWSTAARIHFDLLDLSYAKSYTCQALRNIAKNLHNDYSNFLAGEQNISSVIKRPFELLQYSVSSLLDVLNVKLLRGVDICVESNIPIGCGMGSSAAAVVSTVSALSALLRCDWNNSDQLAFCREIENLQHGKSSGLDLHLVTYGGCVRFENGETQSRAVPKIPLNIVNTGQPKSSTGACVAHVVPAFTNDPELASEFAAITNQIDAALASNNLLEFKQGIRANHRLLLRIGVVPDKVANFIRDIEASGGAAKICGAGAVLGDNAGIVLLVADHDVQDVVTKYGYDLQSVQVDTHGITII
jgi:mevalonate kinase